MTDIARKLATLIDILFVAMALGCASAAKQEGIGEYLDDTVITSKVKAAIFNESTLKSAEINVEPRGWSIFICLRTRIGRPYFLASFAASWIC